jgi:hypothetical protein
MSIDIQGIQEAQAQNNRRIAALQPTGALGAAIIAGATMAHRYAVAITHVWRYKGGALRAAHRMWISKSQAQGVIAIDGSAINPRGQKPATYGVFEHARGGSHRFYERVIDERGQQIIQEMARVMQDGLK